MGLLDGRRAQEHSSSLAPHEASRRLSETATANLSHPSADFNPSELHAPPWLQRLLGAIVAAIADPNACEGRRFKLSDYHVVTDEFRRIGDAVNGMMSGMDAVELMGVPGTLLNGAADVLCFFKEALNTGIHSLVSVKGRLLDLMDATAVGTWGSQRPLPCATDSCLDVQDMSLPLYRNFLFPIRFLKFWDLSQPPLLDSCSPVATVSRFTVPGLASHYSAQSHTLLSQNVIQHSELIKCPTYTHLVAYQPTVVSRCYKRDKDVCRLEAPTSRLAVLDNDGHVISVTEVLDADGMPYNGSITGLTLSKEHQVVWGCGRVDSTTPFSLFTFDLREVLGGEEEIAMVESRELTHPLLYPSVMHDTAESTHHRLPHALCRLSYKSTHYDEAAPGGATRVAKSVPRLWVSSVLSPTAWEQPALGEPDGNHAVGYEVRLPVGVSKYAFGRVRRSMAAHRPLGDHNRPDGDESGRAHHMFVNRAEHATLDLTIRSAQDVEQAVWSDEPVRLAVGARGMVGLRVRWASHEEGEGAAPLRPRRLQASEQGASNTTNMTSAATVRAAQARQSCRCNLQSNAVFRSSVDMADWCEHMTLVDDPEAAPQSTMRQGRVGLTLPGLLHMYDGHYPPAQDIYDIPPTACAQAVPGSWSQRLLSPLCFYLQNDTSPNATSAQRRANGSRTPAPLPDDPTRYMGKAYVDAVESPNATMALSFVLRVNRDLDVEDSEPPVTALVRVEHLVFNRRHKNSAAAHGEYHIAPGEIARLDRNTNSPFFELARFTLRPDRSSLTRRQVRTNEPCTCLSSAIGRLAGHVGPMSIDDIVGGGLYMLPKEGKSFLAPQLWGMLTVEQCSSSHTCDDEGSPFKLRVTTPFASLQWMNSFRFPLQSCGTGIDDEVRR